MLEYKATSRTTAVADYIKEMFEQLGFETIGSHQFAVPVIQDEKNTLSIPARDVSIPIRTLRGNAVTPQTIAPPGIQVPLVYVGNGELQDLNGKAVEGSIILMELESGKNWLYVADLGAKALIYVDRGKSTKRKILLNERSSWLPPAVMPRHWPACVSWSGA